MCVWGGGGGTFFFFFFFFKIVIGSLAYIPAAES